MVPRGYLCNEQTGTDFERLISGNPDRENAKAAL